MEKPIVFLSHSSKDAAALNALKGEMVRRTGSSMAFFLSSDGQSIPLGSNWVHEVETALAAARLMFVFISPDSVASQWVYFEAGFAYSKQLKVVPVGIGGIDVAHLPAPLNLLQGFNLNSGASLNNLIALCNREFGFTHLESFTDEDYQALWRGDDGLAMDSWESLAQIVSTIDLRIPRDTTPITRIESALAAAAVPFQIGSGSVRMHGGRVEEYPDRPDLHVTLDPILLPALLPLFRDVHQAESGPEAEMRFSVSLYPHVSGRVDDLRISARIHGTAVELGSQDTFLYQGITFRVRQQWNPVLGGDLAFAGHYLDATSSPSDLDANKLAALLQLLFDRGVLSVE